MTLSKTSRTLAPMLCAGLLILGACGGDGDGSSQGGVAANSNSASAMESEGPGSGSTSGIAPGGIGGGPIDDGRELPEFEPESYDLVIPDVTYEWDPQAGDPSVSAEDGGPGFTGEGWESNFTFPARGSAEAVKGGRITMYIESWPATLRLMGKDYNTAFNYRARDLCQESLLSVHPQTLEHIPNLATHWKISPDKRTYTYRINPEARWNDGKELTAHDVVATYKLRMDDRILFPSEQLVFGKLNEPKALSKYIVEVEVKDENWRNFLYFSGMAIFPKHQISIPGDEFLKEYQNKYHAMSGPYSLKEEDVAMNKSLTLTRDDSWWAKDNPGWMGVHNFDEYHFIVVQDPSLAFEKAKKGEIDYYIVPKAQWWVEMVVPSKVDAVKRGLIQKRKFFNDAPIGTSGIALNSTRPPLNDIRMRKALGMLRNRPELIDKLFFNEYAPLNSYWQGGTYQNSKNKPLPYDPFTAVELIEEMGWTEFDGDGYRIKDGERLEFELTYASTLSEPSLTIYQEDCKRAGIKVSLKLIDPGTRWQNMRKREYDITSTAWGALVFPNPETSWSGKLAAIVDNNNVTGFSSERVDELLDAYDREYDIAKRIEIIREIDGLVFAEHPYVLDWYNPAQRVIYWNKFSQPEWGVWRTNDRYDMMYCWWVDPEKEKAVEAAMKDTSMVLETEPIQHKFWQHWNAAQAQ
jgi:microcin C transport system substrate-binding protein